MIVLYILIAIFAISFILEIISIICLLPNLAVRSIISIFISGVLIIATGVYLYFGSDSNQTSVVDNMEPAIENNIPTALDVYRGKTELEITYKDSVAIDSTVVYKKIK